MVQDPSLPRFTPSNGILDFASSRAARAGTVTAHYDDQITDLTEEFLASHLQAVPRQHAGCVFLKNNVVVVDDTGYCLSWRSDSTTLTLPSDR